jgi:ABC-type transporter Mla subunit MlaD
MRISEEIDALEVMGKLASTLTAVATALDGRGTQLGQTLARLSDYLGELNPSLPDLKADITGLAIVSGIYDKAAPDLLQALSDLTTTSRTLVEKQQGWPSCSPR